MTKTHFRLTIITNKGVEDIHGMHIALIEGEMLLRWDDMDGRQKRQFTRSDSEMYIIEVDEDDEEVENGYYVDLYDVLVMFRRYKDLIEYFEVRYIHDLVEYYTPSDVDDVFADLHKDGTLECYADRYKVIRDWIAKRGVKTTYSVEIPLAGWYMTDVVAYSVEEAIEKAREKMSLSNLGEVVDEDEHAVIIVNEEVVDDHL